MESNRELSPTQVARDAVRKVAGVAEGKSAAEVRSMLIDELRSRGVEPSGEALELYVALTARAASARVSGHPVPGAAYRSGRWARMTSRARIVSNAKIMRDVLPQYRVAKKTQFIDPDWSRAAMEVVLDATARHLLSTGELSLPRRADPSRRVDIWLDIKIHQDGREAVRVHLMDRTIGYLRPEDGDVFHSAIEAANADGCVLMTSGYIATNDDAHFYVYHPLPGLA